MKLLRIEGTIVRREGTSFGEISINQDSGLIESVGNPTGKAEIILDRRHLIFPGFGDLHVHAREDESGSQNYKEDFESMSHAAIRGGVTHVGDMPNNPISPTTAERYKKKAELARKSLVRVTLYGGIGPVTKPFPFRVPYKAFMGPSVGDLFFTSYEELEEVIACYPGEYVSFHCEDPSVLEKNKNELTHEARRPKEAEISGVDFALYLIQKYRLHGKLCHISLLDGVRKAVESKRRGASVTIEVTPHHLYFDASMITEKNRLWLQMNPPLRTSHDDKLELVESLRRGDIDYLATDHAPHTIEEKTNGISGVPHLDTYGAFVTWLMGEHHFSPEEIARVCSYNPGRFVQPFLPKGFGNGFGDIAPGWVGSLTVIDPDRPTTITRDTLKTKCGWSPFEGITFPGSVVYTILKGRAYKIS
jgi:dihydroorotase